MRRRVAALALPVAVLVACGDGDDVAAFCERAGSLEDLEGIFEGDGLPDAAGFERAAAEVDDLAGEAPEEVAGDVHVVADALGAIAEVVAGVDLSDPSTLRDPTDPAALQELADDLEALGEDVERAQRRIDAYLEEECGLSVDDE